MKNRFTKALAVLLLLLSTVFGSFIITSSSSQFVYADEVPAETGRVPATTVDPDDLPEINDNSEEGENTSPSDGEENNDPETSDDSNEEGDDDTEPTPVCQAQVGSLSWIVCPSIELITNITDSVYGAIEQLLVVQPLSTSDDSPIYLIWQYMRSITNIVFVIFLIVVIYSQITGLGISNYGVKRILPRLIITVVLVNLSYLICTLAVDLSNILGFSIRNTLGSIQENIINLNPDILSQDLSIGSIVGTLLSSGAIAHVTISAIGGLGWLFWMLVPILIAAVVSVITGLITIAARQALIALLIMIAPLAIVAYLLPNTEKWFTKWKDLLMRMLVFYPLFSFLFGASQLAGWALIASATNALGVILGLGVQIIPLFLSFSLMKMSGTVLGTLNNGLRRITSPVQHAAAGWSLGHAEHRRQLHLGYSNATGARLRQTLDYRRDRRELETHNALETRRNRSMANVYNNAASYKGRDDEGNMSWNKRPNRQTRNAKIASYYSTLASNAKVAYDNTLGEYSSHFTDQKSQQLNFNHGQAFIDSATQRHLAENIAEADQQFLLKQHMDAVANSEKDPYEYNRLIRSAAGGLGHNGEAAIMGQVIVNSSAIETRRRSEARIIINKFGYSKSALRAMALDKADINDNGYETDENGNVIEDEMYNLITHDKDGNPTGYKRRKWPHYIAVHKDTGAEITKAEYDTLSNAEREHYRKVRYLDIRNDKQELMQRIFEDDAGYMKEILRDDIAVADPINRRYETEIGVDPDTLESGILRRYHSTISAAIRETKYKEKDAASNSMLVAQLDRGYITSKGQLNIAALQSLTSAAKAGDFLRNDSQNIKELTHLIGAMNDDVAFAKYFPDEAIMKYRNVNGIELDGWRLVTSEDGKKQFWQEINHNDPTITLEDKKNLVRHKIIPKAAAKIVSMFNRKVSPAVIDDMKSGDDLKALIESISQMAIDNITNQKLGKEEPLAENDINLFASSDPSVFQSVVSKTKAELEKLRNSQNGNNSDGNNDGDSTPPSGGSGSPRRGGPRGGNGDGSGSNNSSPTPHTHEGVKRFKDRSSRANQDDENYRYRNSYDTITRSIEEMFDYEPDYDTVTDQLTGYFDTTESLQPLLPDLNDLIEEYRFDDRAASKEQAIGNIVNYYDHEQDRINTLHDAVVQLVNRAETY